MKAQMSDQEVREKLAQQCRECYFGEESEEFPDIAKVQCPDDIFKIGWDAAIAHKESELEGLRKQLENQTCGYCDFDRSLAKELVSLKSAVRDMAEELKYYADPEVYKDGSGEFPPFSCEFGEIIEHSYISVCGDDNCGEGARSILSKHAELIKKCSKNNDSEEISEAELISKLGE